MRIPRVSAYRHKASGPKECYGLGALGKVEGARLSAQRSLLDYYDHFCDMAAKWLNKTDYRRLALTAEDRAKLGITFEHVPTKEERKAERAARKKARNKKRKQK